MATFLAVLACVEIVEYVIEGVTMFVFIGSVLQCEEKETEW